MCSFLILFILFCVVLCIFCPLVYSCPFPNFVHVYRPLLPGGNPVVGNKYRIITCVVLPGYLDRCWLPVWLQSFLLGMSL